MALNHDEMIEILEEIPRSSANAASRIAAIKALKEIDDGRRKPAEGFAELDELAERRGRSGQGKR
jgi:hypothetical protein